MLRCPAKDLKLLKFNVAENTVELCLLLLRHQDKYLIENDMITWRRAATSTMFSALFVTVMAGRMLTLQAQLTKPVLPKTPPNILLKVERQAGNCPQTVGLWTAFRYYEGGGEHAVIADTWAIAQRAQITTSGKKFVEYKAPLRTDFTTCVGQAKANDYPYQLQFGKGNVAFTVKLPPDTAANPSVITAKSILGARPFVRWAIAD